MIASQQRLHGETRQESRSRNRAIIATTLPELLVSLCVLAIGFAGIWATAGRCLQMARTHGETIAATETLLRRVENCRASGWNTIVTASAIKNNILQEPAVETGSLPGIEEQITVAPYPPVTPAPVPIVVQRHANGTVQIISEPPPGLYLRSILAVRVDFRVTWSSAQNRGQHIREMSTVVSAQGLLR